MNFSLLWWMIFCFFYLSKVGSARTFQEDHGELMAAVTEAYEQLQSRELGENVAKTSPQPRDVAEPSPQPHVAPASWPVLLPVQPVSLQLPVDVVVMSGNQGPAELSVDPNVRDDYIAFQNFPTLLLHNYVIGPSSSDYESGVTEEKSIGSGISGMHEGKRVKYSRTGMAEENVRPSRNGMTEETVPSSRTGKSEEKIVSFAYPWLSAGDKSSKPAETKPEMSNYEPSSRKKRSVSAMDSDPKDSIREGREERGSEPLVLKEYLKTDTSESWEYDSGSKITFPKGTRGYRVYNNPGNLTVSNNIGERFYPRSTKSVVHDGEVFSESKFENGIKIIYKPHANNNPRLNVREGRASILYDV